MGNRNTVMLSETEHQELLQDQELLRILEACGVDNWCGYEDAMEMFDESE